MIILAILAVIALLIVGLVLVGVVFKLLWWFVAGLVIGGLARLILPGHQPIGLLATGLYGIAGALLGGIIGTRVLHLGWVLELLLAIGVAAALVALFSRMQHGGHRGRTPVMRH